MKRKQDLDAILQELALTNFEEFCQVMATDLSQAYVCLKKKKGKSYRQIAQELGLTRHEVDSRVKKCPPCSDRK